MAVQKTFTIVYGVIVYLLVPYAYEIMVCVILWDLRVVVQRKSISYSISRSPIQNKCKISQTIGDLDVVKDRHLLLEENYLTSKYINPIRKNSLALAIQ